MQRLNTSKVANVGAKAKVWPDKQCRRVCAAVWSGVGGFWKMQEPRRGRGGIEYYYSDSRSGHGMHGRESSLANGSPGESSGNANGHSGTLSQTHALVWGHSAGMKGTREGCEWPLRRRRKWPLRSSASVWPMQLGLERGKV